MNLGSPVPDIAADTRTVLLFREHRSALAAADGASAPPTLLKERA